MHTTRPRANVADNGATYVAALRGLFATIKKITFRDGSHTLLFKAIRMSYSKGGGPFEKYQHPLHGQQVFVGHYLQEGQEWVDPTPSGINLFGTKIQPAEGSDPHYKGNVMHLNFPITKSTIVGIVGLATYLYSEDCLKLPTNQLVNVDLYSLLWPEVQGRKPAWISELADTLDEHIANRAPAGESLRKPGRKKRARSTAAAPAGSKRVRGRGDSLIPVPEAPVLRETEARVRVPSPPRPAALGESSSGGGGGVLLIGAAAAAFLLMR